MIIVWIVTRGFGQLLWSIGDDLLVIVGARWRDSMGRTGWHQ